MKHSPNQQTSAGRTVSAERMSSLHRAMQHKEVALRRTGQQMRDLAHEIDILRRENARLRSLTGEPTNG